ncbi:hypothetical protein QEJ31_02250 [Pigmentibacter sp. JX0631]|uniref:hypothetical protein n=1 Tax=Pigmentibacter sp. JX0631 TaxID=2976982 RepID=UPI00246993C5|nr:hypothetical protein [Pigmentibacter sp. JX0631]WGL60426.1 hypothetical protein QEJ31_02250 [Pigmentibacter sp. JX0631]
MVEVFPLTLFHNFFKSNLIKAVSFKVFLLVFILLPLKGYADRRVITLFPHDDLQLIDNNENYKLIRIGVTESLLNLSFIPCLFEFNQIPLLYSVLQVGLSCSTKIAQANILSVSVHPETNYSKEVNKKGVALGIGLAYNYYLNTENNDWLFFFKFNYKFWDNELTDSSYQLSTKQLYQIWGSVFDSNYKIGLIHNYYDSDTPLQTNLSLEFYYLQSFPLEWRQIGGARNTASVEYKALGFSVRKEFISHFILGVGIAYWNLTFDGIRISGPLPDAYLGIDF